MSTLHTITELKELLASQLDRLAVLQKNKLWASAQVMERKIQETRNAISRHGKKQKTR